MKGIIAGVIAGITGALVWALIAYYTGYEIGYLAWGIGVAVGIAVAWGTEGGQKNGIIAVMIVILAIIAGKYTSVEISVSKGLKSANAQINQSMEAGDDFLISWLASAIAYNVEEEGGKVNWFAGVTADTAENKQHYPSRIWNAAKASWTMMTDAEKASFKSDVQAQIKANLNMYTNQVRSEGFLKSFSAFDLIFFFLAVTTAFKVASARKPQHAAENNNDKQENPEIQQQQQKEESAQL